MEAIAAWHEAEPRQEPPGAKPTLQNILQDSAENPGLPAENHPWEKDWHGSYSQCMEARSSLRTGTAFSLASPMNYLQASSRLFLHSVPTSIWVMLEYNVQNSAQVNSESVWISNSRRNCTSPRGPWMTSCKMDKTLVYPYLIPRNKLCRASGSCHHARTWNGWTTEHTTTMQRWSTLPGRAGRLSKQMS